ncbi:MAG: YjbH domain-containing protein [Alphaproteobacteria bacterium]|nr:MAG: YjbH domain-containing protein [Alphaproteobacteria bacterium]
MRTMRGLCAIALLALAGRAEAAGTAYGVDTAEVGEVGNCKIESWLSWASNQDFIGVTNPSCVVDLTRPVELSVQLQRARADGEWGASAAPKFKTNIIPSAIGQFGVAIAGGAMFDLLTQEHTGLYAYVPATLRLSNVVRINLNAGWQWDRIADRHFVTYGAGVDWRTPDNVWTLTAEVFGLLGQADSAAVTQPRFQVGLRWRPIDRFSMDVILGRNIAGESANWITLATSIRFPASGK